MAKPVHLDMVGRLTQRERLWQTARRLKEFTLMEWQDKTKPLVILETVETYLRCLKAGGYLVPVEPKHQKSKKSLLDSRMDRPEMRHGFDEQRYRLVKQPLEAPRLTAHGKPINTGIAQLAMWRAMKALKEFTWHDIHHAANLPPMNGKPGLVVSALAAKTYVSRLSVAGYFRVIRASQPCGGRGGALPARYRLARDTGALPPAVTKRLVVFDRNTGEFVYQQSEQEVCDGLE